MPDTREIQKIMQIQNLAGFEKFSKRTVAEELERKNLIELLKSGGVRDFPFNAALADHLIANGVTVPVRCKGCKYYMEHPASKRMCCYVHLLTPHHMREDGFCSYGERRNDG